MRFLGRLCLLSHRGARGESGKGRVKVSEGGFQVCALSLTSNSSRGGG